MGSNKMGIGSPIPPVSEVESVSVCGCEAGDWPLQLIRLSIGHEEAVFSVVVWVCVRCWTLKYSHKNYGTTRHINCNSTGRGRWKQGLSDGSDTSRMLGNISWEHGVNESNCVLFELQGTVPVTFIHYLSSTASETYLISGCLKSTSTSLSKVCHSWMF